MVKRMCGKAPYIACLYTADADGKAPCPRQMMKRRIAMSKVKKVIALVLVVALCVSLLSTLAFADDSWKPTWPGEGGEAQPYSVLFFGDESLGYEGSYAQGFVNFVQNTLGAGYKVNGFWANKDYPGLRHSDLYSAIRPNAKDIMFTVFGVDNLAPTKDKYNTELFENAEAAKEAGIEMIQLQSFLTEYGIGGTIGEALATLDIDDRYPGDSVKAIVLDLTHNDLTSYLLARVTDTIENYIVKLTDYLDKHEGSDEGFTYFYDGPYAGDVLDLPAQLSSEVHIALEYAMMILGQALDITLYPGLENQLRAAIEYTLVNFCLGFTETALALKYWYPTAKLMVIGASNELKGVKVVIPNTPLLPQPEDKEADDDDDSDVDEEVKTVEEVRAEVDEEPAPAPAPVTIDLGAIYESMADFANSYITDFASKYSVNNTYYFANVEKLGGVETIYMAADNSEDASENGEKAYDDFKDAINKDIAGLIWNKYKSDFAAFKELLNIESAGLDSFDDMFGENIIDGIVELLNEKTNLADNVIQATNWAKFDLTEMSIDKLEPAAIATTLFDCMFVDFDTIKENNPTAIALLALYGLTLDDGYVLHPSMAGQATKLDAVKKAFLSLRPANTEGEDVVGNLFIDGIVAVLNVFKSDILNALQTIFSPDFFSNFFGRISNLFSGFFDGKIEFGDGKLF